MPEFVHLHVHSYYSLLDGLGSPAALAKYAKEQGMRALALTDHGVMYGAVEFYEACRKEGIKPIIGCEVYVAPNGRFQKRGKEDTRPHHLLLLAENETGYKNLIQLTTKAHLEGFYYKPRVDYELLQEHAEGLIATTACLAGEVPRQLANGDEQAARKAVLRYQQIFGKDNFFLELQYHPGIPVQQEVNQKVAALAQEMEVPLVATNDVHYVRREDAEAHDILICVQTNRLVSDIDRMKYTCDFSLKSPAEMAESFADYPEAIANTVKIAERCQLELTLGKHFLMPPYKTPEGQEAVDYLRELCAKGMLKRYGVEPAGDAKWRATPRYQEIKEHRGPSFAFTPEEIGERLEYELDLIHKMGFDTYFLIVWDFVHYARKSGIVVGPGRGSAAGAITTYVLGITDIDPLEHGLVFERFLNPERISMPDIDMDFADSRRAEVIEYVTQKYGRSNVAQIITFGTMAARAAIRDVGRALGMAYMDVDRAAKAVPFKPGLKLAEALAHDANLKDIYHDPQYTKLLDMAQKLEGVVRHASTHACAVVISDRALTEYTPLQQSSSGDTSIVTQYSMKPLDKLGLLKMDFLGLKNLTILENTVNIIEQEHGQKIVLGKLPLDDAKTYELLGRGETTGVFQLESDGMKRYLRELKPTKFGDIIAMVSLYRPGPMEYIPDYIAGKHGKKKVSYLHPVLEPILKETYGIAVYQEQVLEIAKKFAGFSLGEADLLRRAIGKKIKSELDAQRDKFIQKAIGQGQEKALAEKLFSFIEPFANYGFNKSHAACYAMIAYQTAYLKANYPTEFMAALLTSDHGNTDRIIIEINECKHMGIRVLGPSVNESFMDFTVTGDKEIRFGLLAIKNLGEGPADLILQAREQGGAFNSLDDFLHRVDSNALNKKVIEALAYSGAFLGMEHRESICENIDKVTAYAKAVQGRAKNGQVSLFGGMEESSNSKIELSFENKLTEMEKLAGEKEFLGIYLSSHPLEQISAEAKGDCIDLATLKKSDEGRLKRVCGIISTIKKITTRNGQQMLFARLDDLSSSLELIVFPRLLEANPGLWEKDQILKVTGKVTFKDQVGKGDDEPKMICEQAELLTEKSFGKSEVPSSSFFVEDLTSGEKHGVDLSDLPVEQKKVQVLKIKVPSTLGTERLKELKEYLQSQPGNLKCRLLFGNGDPSKHKEIELPFGINFSDNLKAEVKRILNS
ncbi:MAG: DNA polymerase III subunit alpha [Candidatus Gracilibacteria bacterium]|nr:DNA polymerase III subunit alpha [Candidatus Gracilibacteria bacterium]